MTVHIRRACSSDAPALAVLLRDLHMFDFVNNQPAEAVQAQVQKHLDLCLADDSHSVCAAENDAGHFVGYVSVHWLPYLLHPGPEGYISELFVGLEARSEGVGTQLLTAVKQEAEARGCYRLSLLNLRDRESYRRGFYEQRGWEERPDAANFIYLFR